MLVTLLILVFVVVVAVELPGLRRDYPPGTILLYVVVLLLAFGLGLSETMHLRTPTLNDLVTRLFMPLGKMIRPPS